MAAIDEDKPEKDTSEPHKETYQNFIKKIECADYRAAQDTFARNAKLIKNKQTGLNDITRWEYHKLLDLELDIERQDSFKLQPPIDVKINPEISVDYISYGGIDVEVLYITISPTSDNLDISNKIDYIRSFSNKKREEILQEEITI